MRSRLFHLSVISCLSFDRMLLTADRIPGAMPAMQAAEIATLAEQRKWWSKFVFGGRVARQLLIISVKLGGEIVPTNEGRYGPLD